MRLYAAGTLAIWLGLSAGALGAQEPAKRAPNNMFGQWSHDGKKIVFTSDRDGDPEIYVMSADGGNAVRLTHVAGRDAHPFFSPDGRKIVFQSPRGSTPAEGAWPDTYIYVMNANGSQQTRITSLGGFSGVPVYSPDGKRIAFQRTADLKNFHWQIFVMNTDGSGLKQITDDGSNNQVPNWSRDGRRLIFFSNRSGKDQIYSMNGDGSDVRRIAETPHNDTSASWSPDGERIVFASDRDGNPEIYRMNADGSGVVRLTHTEAIERAPVWSPDGRQILFATQRDGNAEIYLMDAEGGNVQRITGKVQAGGTCDPTMLREFSFMLGRWKDDRSNGLTVTAFFDGLGFQEHWTNQETGEAWAVRSCDPRSKSLFYTWVSPTTAPQIWEGRKDEGGWKFYRSWSLDGETIVSRTYWVPGAAGSFARVVEQSRDGGKTWRLHAQAAYTSGSNR